MSLLLPSRRCVRSPFCSDEIVRSAFVAERRLQRDWSRRSRGREKDQKHQFCKGATNRQTELAVASSLVCWPRLHAHYEFHGRSTVVLLFQRTEICLLGTKVTTFANISVALLMPYHSMTHRLHYCTITFIYLFSHIQTTDEAMVR